jgi:predicted O-methyltransferase YrrM
MFATERAATVPGWFNHGAQILALLEQHRPMVVVELGTWLGASAIPMALSVRRWGGTVTCIDTWAGELDDDGGSTGGGPIMLSRCAANMVEAGVHASVRLIPATTLEAAATWTQPIDCLYIDADHSYAGCAADLAVWGSFVRRGGLVMGDDYGQAHYPGVKQAWDDYAHRMKMTVTIFQSDPPAPAGGQLVYGVIPKE